MLIRAVTETDLAAVETIILRDWDEVLQRYHSAAMVAKFRGQVSQESLRDQMAWKRIYVVEVDGTVVATGALANFGLPEAPKHSVSNFFVCPELQGQGIGSKLLDFLCEVARGQGIASLHVPSTRNAVSFYGKKGFAPESEQPSLEDEITWMNKAL